MLALIFVSNMIFANTMGCCICLYSHTFSSPIHGRKIKRKQFAESWDDSGLFCCFVFRPKRTGLRGDWVCVSFYMFALMQRENNFFFSSKLVLTMMTMYPARPSELFEDDFKLEVGDSHHKQIHYYMLSFKIDAFIDAFIVYLAICFKLFCLLNCLV